MNEIDEKVDVSIVKKWRSQGVINAEEIVYRAGDLYVAENVITKTRRIIHPPVTESIGNKRVLKG